MTVTGGTTVAFSASIDAPSLAGAENGENCEPYQKPTGTPMMLQVSMMTTVPKPMGIDDFNKFIEFLKKSKDVIEKISKCAKDFYKDNKDMFEMIDAEIKVFEGVGKIIGGIMKFLPEKEDPMVQNLAGLESEVRKLGEKLNEHFGELKAFIGEQSFFTNIIKPTTVLIKHMSDCLEAPGPDTKELFREAYHENFPLKLQYILRTYLDNKTTNPLTLSMDAAKVKTKAMFDKWEDIICRVMVQFLILEAFANGLLESKSAVNRERQITSSIDIFTDMNVWRERYSKDGGYWEEFKNFLVPFIENNARLSNGQKADTVLEKLNSYLTRDEFYIFVFNQTTWEKNYYYFCPQEEGRLIGVWGKGGCNALVYRSETGWANDELEYDRTKKRFDEFSRNNDWEHTLKGILHNQVFKNLGSMIGFYCLMDGSCKEEIRQLNHLPSINGPGSIDIIKRPSQGDLKLIRSFW